MDLYGQDVFPCFCQIGNIKPCRGLAVFGHTQKFAIEIEVGCPFCSIGTEDNIFSDPRLRDFEFFSICSRGIKFFRNQWWIGPIPIRRISGRNEFIARIYVNRDSESLNFPIAGNIDIAPTFVVKIFFIEPIHRTFVKIVRVMKFPFTVQKKEFAPF